MHVKVLKEAGYEEALQGIGLSYNITDMKRLKRVACTLAPKDGGHNKFIESMVVWLEIRAPRYWWQEYDTYRTGTTKQSESTMHTITKGELTQDNFELPIHEHTLIYLNTLIREYNLVTEPEAKETLFRAIKNELPEGFLQTRIVCTNYKVLKNMVAQRKNHRLREWQIYINRLRTELQYPKILFGEHMYE